MKKILSTIALIALLFPTLVVAQTTTIPWAFNLGRIFTPPTATSVAIPFLGSTGNPCLTVGTTGTLATSTCGGSPAGSNTQIQYNDNGLFGATTTFVYSGGNVGIGTANPTNGKLEVITSDTSSRGINLSQTNTSATGNVMNISNSGTSNTALRVSSAASGADLHAIHGSLSGVIANGFQGVFYGNITNASSSSGHTFYGQHAGTAGSIYRGWVPGATGVTGLNLLHDNAGATGSSISVTNVGSATNGVIYINNDGNGRSLNIDKDVTNTNSTGVNLQLDHTSVVNDAGTYTKTGAALQINSNVIETSGTITDSAQVLDINQTHADATGNVVDIFNAGTGISFRNNTTGTGVAAHFTAGTRTAFIGNQGSNTGLGFEDNIFDGNHADSTGIVSISQRNTGGSGVLLRMSNVGTSGRTIRIQDTNTGSGQTGSSIDIDKDGNSASAITGLWVNTANAGAGAANAAIFEAGLVGIGTTTPSSLLTVAGTTTATCFTTDGTSCITGSGTVNSGTLGQVAFYNASGAAVSGTSTIFLSGGNVGIGITTPDTPLQVNGSTTIASKLTSVDNIFTSAPYDLLTIGDNPAATDVVTAAGIRFQTKNSGAATQGTRLIQNGNQFDIWTGVGTQSHVMTFLGNANVGIGTTTPSQKLVVSGNALVTGTSTLATTSATSLSVNITTQLAKLTTVGNNITYASTTGISNYALAIVNNSNDNGQKPGIAFFNSIDTTPTNTPGAAIVHDRIGSWSRGGLSFWTKDVTTQTGVLEQRLTILSTGNTGIGTTTPASVLSIGTGQIEVPAGSAAAPAYSFSGDLDTGIYRSSDNSLDFSTAGNRRALINSFGFQMASSSGALLRNVSASDTTPSIVPNKSEVETGLGASSAGALSLITSGTTKLQITNAGLVGIGTTTPTSKLQVDGGMRLSTLTAKPTCDVSIRGTFWITQGGAGVKDDVEVCVKDAGDSYLWATIY
jgi:hypothetical protein